MLVQYQVVCRVGLEVKKEADNHSRKVSGSELRLPTAPDCQSSVQCESACWMPGNATQRGCSFLLKKGDFIRYLPGPENLHVFYYSSSVRVLILMHRKHIQEKKKYTGVPQWTRFSVSYEANMTKEH